MNGNEASVQKEPCLLMRLVAAPFAALSFLTVLPVPVPGSSGGFSMGWAVACFPLAGAFLGLCLASLDWLLAAWFPPMLQAALLLAALLAVTGALHLDGLMDSADGMFGGKDRASRLAIMKDSRVGSFGIAAASVVLLTEYSSLASPAEVGKPEALILALTLSRWAMAAILWLFPAAGSTGLAAGLKPKVRWVHAGAATVIAVAIVVALSKWTGGVMVLLSGVMMLMMGWLAVSKLGGITGDSCGATGQLVEAAVLVACTALVR
jgi:adenosylcobinamide-GDP ribazoletransferase